MWDASSFFCVTFQVSTVIICLREKNNKWENAAHLQQIKGNSITVRGRVRPVSAPWSLTSLSRSLNRSVSPRDHRLNIAAIIHVWRDLMTVSTAPPPACLTLYWTETNYKFPAHFLEFSWYQKSIFVLYLNNRLKLFLSGQFLIISRVREREQTKHYVKQIYNCL